MLCENAERFCPAARRRNSRQAVERRADWRSRWWRVGAVFLTLMLVADPVVWEGYPGAYTRVLLPMTLAFNLLLPGRKWFWPLLVLGNLSVIPGIQALRIPLVWRLF